jgi:hypothetical protein
VPGNLLILALLAGFCFLHNCYRFKFWAQLLDGYRLLLACSVSGAILLLISRVLISLGKLNHLFWQLRPLWDNFAGVPYLGTFALSVPIGWGAAKIWNLFVEPEACRRRALIDHGDSLMALMQTAVEGERMISVTFDSRKWYAGYIVEAPDLKPREKYFKLLPVISGYRDKDTLAAVATLSYAAVYQSPGVVANDFVITLPIEAVRTANLFDPSVYEEHFVGSAHAAPSVSSAGAM